MQGNFIISIPMADFFTAIEATVRKVLSEKEVETDKLLISDQVMQMFNVSSTTLQKWRNNGHIPFIKVDNKILYSKAEILKALPSKTRDKLI